MPRLKGGKTLVPVAVRVSSETELTLKAIKKSGVDVNNELRLLIEAFVEGALQDMGANDKEALLAELNFGRVLEAPKANEKSSAQGRFNKKLQSNDFESFTGADWVRYFEHKSREKGLAFVKHQFASSIIKSAMGKYSPELIKQMIDFVYDSGQTEFDVSQSPVMCLSKNWIAFSLNKSQDWVTGKYSPNIGTKKSLPKRESSKLRQNKTKKSLGDGVDI